jgi:aspartate oxidase
MFAFTFPAVAKSLTSPTNSMFAIPLVPGKYYAHGPITIDFKEKVLSVKVMFAPYK